MCVCVVLHAPCLGDDLSLSDGCCISIPRPRRPARLCAQAGPVRCRSTVTNTGVGSGLSSNDPNPSSYRQTGRPGVTASYSGLGKPSTPAWEVGARTLSPPPSARMAVGDQPPICHVSRSSKRDSSTSGRKRVSETSLARMSECSESTGFLKLPFCLLVTWSYLSRDIYREGEDLGGASRT